MLTLLNLTSFAQSDSSLKHVDLDEFVYNSGKPKSKKYKVKINNVVQQILPSDKSGIKDTFGYLTHFPALGGKTVSIFEVECRIDEYDTSEMSMFLIFLQIYDGDTIIRRISLDRDIIKRNKTAHHFAGAEVLTVQPGDFYLGYAYFTRSSNAIERRFYCSMQQERAGAFLFLEKGNVGLLPNKNFNVIFPFSIKYY